MYTSFNDFFKVIQLDTGNLGFLDDRAHHYEHREFQRRIKRYASFHLVGAFRAQTLGACIGGDGGLHYELNSEIVLSSSFKNLEEKARKVNPNRHTRLGTRREYDLYCASLIQHLLKEGYDPEEAYGLVLDKKGNAACRRSGCHLIGKDIWSDHLIVPHCVYEDESNHKIIAVQGAEVLLPLGQSAAPWVVAEV